MRPTTHFRVYWKKLGGHVHARVFSAPDPRHTHGKNGDLVFRDGDEWIDFCDWAKRGNVELIGEPWLNTSAAGEA